MLCWSPHTRVQMPGFCNVKITQSFRNFSPTFSVIYNLYNPTEKQTETLHGEKEKRKNSKVNWLHKHANP